MPWDPYFRYYFRLGQTFLHLRLRTFDFFEIPAWVFLPSVRTAYTSDHCGGVPLTQPPCNVMASCIKHAPWRIQMRSLVAFKAFKKLHLWYHLLYTLLPVECIASLPYLLQFSTLKATDFTAAEILLQIQTLILGYLG